MKPTIVIVVTCLLALSPFLVAEPTPLEAAIEQAKKEPSFTAFAEQVIEATKSADADSLKRLTVIGDGKAFWEAHVTGLQMIDHKKVKSSTYDFDASKRFYEKKGTKWDMSLPIDGELTIIFELEPQKDLTDYKTTVRSLVAKTAEGWRIALPTKKQ